MNRTQSGALHAHSPAYAKTHERDTLPPLVLARVNILMATIALETAWKATGCDYDLAAVVAELQKFEEWRKGQAASAT